MNQQHLTGETLQFFQWLQSQPVVLVFLELMVIDILTGLIASGIKKQLSSDISLKGMAKKIIMLLLLGTADTLGRLSPDIPVLKLAAMFLCVTEGMSILENAGRAGVPIPVVLRDMLAKISTATEQQANDAQGTPITAVAVATVTTAPAQSTAPAQIGDTNEQ